MLNFTKIQLILKYKESFHSFLMWGDNSHIDVMVCFC